MNVQDLKKGLQYIYEAQGGFKYRCLVLTISEQSTRIIVLEPIGRVGNELVTFGQELYVPAEKLLERYHYRSGNRAHKEEHEILLPGQRSCVPVATIGSVDNGFGNIAYILKLTDTLYLEKPILINFLVDAYELNHLASAEVDTSKIQFTATVRNDIVLTLTKAVVTLESRGSSYLYECVLRDEQSLKRGYSFTLLINLHDTGIDVI